MHVNLIVVGLLLEKQKLFINHLKIKKMKKISLKDIKDRLKRDEMRAVIGGLTVISSDSCVSAPGCASGCSDGWYCSDCGTCKK